MHVIALTVSTECIMNDHTALDAKPAQISEEFIQLHDASVPCKFALALQIRIFIIPAKDDNSEGIIYKGEILRSA